MWKTNNYKGEAVTLYSEEEYNKLLIALERIRAYLRTAVRTNNGNKFFENVYNAYQVTKDVMK